MNGAYVGSWSLGPNAPDTLQYDSDWTRSEQGRPLSLSLPFVPSFEIPGFGWPCSPRSLIVIRGMGPRGTRDEAAKT